MTFTPTDPTKAEVRVTGTAPDQQLDFYIPAGPTGAPGGFVSGTDLTTMDLNGVTAPGLYRQPTFGNATTALNYPTNGTSGVLEVTDVLGSTNVLQRFTTFGGTANGSAHVIYERRNNGGTWDPWRAFASTRVDQTAGRAIYQWDEQNGREQLTYGDTGVRRIETLLLNGWTGAIVALRRVGNVVSFGVYNLSPAAQTGTVAYTLPVGFRPAGFGGNTGYPVKTANVICDWMNLDSAGNIMPPISSGIVGSGFICVNSWTTNDTWPTTLPGTASGSIPNV